MSYVTNMYAQIPSLFNAKEHVYSRSLFTKKILKVSLLLHKPPSFSLIYCIIKFHYMEVPSLRVELFS